MSVVVIEQPAPVVTWDEARRHLRLDGDDEKTYVEGLILAAQGHIDGPAGWLGRAVGEQTIELRFDSFYRPCEGALIRLPYRPIVDVVSVARIDSDGAEIEISDENYALVVDRIAPRNGLSWPPGGGVIRYVAGYPADQVPAPIKQAILLMIGSWYKNREEVVVGATVAELPMAAQALLSLYRVYA